MDGPEQNLALCRESAQPLTKTGESSSTSSRAHPVNPETYFPKTLKEVLERRQRLSVNECV
jgi:hypothetical protein